MRAAVLTLMIIFVASMIPMAFSKSLFGPKVEAAEDLISITADTFNEKAAAVIDAKSEIMSIIANAAAKKGQALIKAGARIKGAIAKGAVKGISAIGKKIARKIGLIGSGAVQEVRPPSGGVEIVIDNRPVVGHPVTVGVVPCYDNTGAIIGYVPSPIQGGIAPGTVWGLGIPPQGQVQFGSANQHVVYQISK